MLVHLSIDYRSPIGPDDQSVTVTLDIPRLGESSLPMNYEISVSGSTAATAETVQVAYDSAAEQSKPLPAAWREAIVAEMGLE